MNIGELRTHGQLLGESKVILGLLEEIHVVFVAWLRILINDRNFVFS